MWGPALVDFGRLIRAVATVVEESFFQKNEKTVLIKFPGLAILGRYNSSMITNSENSRPNGPSTRCLVFIFIVRINSKSFPWDVRCAPERYLFKFSAIVDGDRGRLTES